MRDLNFEEIKEVNGGSRLSDSWDYFWSTEAKIDAGTIASGAGVIGLGVAIVATGGLGMAAVGVAATATPTITAGSLGLSALGGYIIGSGFTFQPSK
ncbi:hypothetical protein [Aquimarina algicola]|uniref:Bacteriocin n=1 Tax=Aquimarina algicola TaxID=2589995 RepID=A0A504J7T8_9FLAO|nr:hypothetical protein [Aquimarina algicola]TPN82760.1 hypothetical protein FHK87_20240 [Aquimarina algicola]